MVVFWGQGYEGASLTDLTSAMGITNTSMYAAFSNKEELLCEALERYAEGPAAYAAMALEQPTALPVATPFLAGSVGACTRPARPAGCLGVQGSPDAGRTVRDALAAWRDEGRARLLDRFRRAVREGDLPGMSIRGCSPGTA
ncbi:hypothetical protein GCM10022222_06510 [Amycolatopsis ultiminotia]|uniref:HTH tetR-type domain-containing protein n=1 Tax=Amycolatopsis ultiminotia TaxID=543629 RepID=A0ABP6V521_9PSEU